ncbi:MAG: hypothetical protein Q7I98_07980 [Erysipelotrichaceae bacterium]|nr:hypothetical protein [Erysipelotrichaceae bacterium]
MRYKKCFAKCIGSFLKAPFKKGGVGPDGYDCIGLLDALATELDLEHPIEFESWNKDNYSDLYEKDPKVASEVMLRFFDSFAEKLDINRVVAGDLIVVEQSDGVLFPALYTGSGNAVTSTIRNGVCVIHIDDLNKIKFAWRMTCRQKLQ